MSPRWTTELAVAVGAHDLTVQVRRRLPGGRDGPAKSYALKPPRTAAEAAAALAHAIPRVVADGAAPSTARVLLADCWAHYAMITGDFRSMKPADVRSLAGEYLHSALDLKDAPLTVRAAVLPGGRALFAAAIDRQLLDGLTGALATRGVRPRSMSTWFAAVAANWRRDLPAGRCAVACEFGGTLQLALVEGERWHAFASDVVRAPGLDAVRARVDLFLRRLGESVDALPMAVAAPVLDREPATGESARRPTMPVTRISTPQVDAGVPLSQALLAALA